MRVGEVIVVHVGGLDFNGNEERVTNPLRSLACSSTLLTYLSNDREAIDAEMCNYNRCSLIMHNDVGVH